jgi:hypothetical protein
VGLWIALAIGAVLLLICLCVVVVVAVSGSDDDSDNVGQPPTGTTSTAAAAPGLNTPVQDGNFQFTVTSSECGHTMVGDDEYNKTAEGQFCLVSLKVKNTADQPHAFSDTMQAAIGADGTSYSADSEAGVYVNEGGQALIAMVEPGETLTAVLVFDIPTGTSLATVQLHDTPGSKGATVTVS